MSNEIKARRGSKTVIERTYRARIEEVWELWTTKEGFESWWGPEGFRVEVHALDARAGGALQYDMIADSPEMVAAMKQMGVSAHDRLQRRAHDRLQRLSRFRGSERQVVAGRVVESAIDDLAVFDERAA